MAGPTDQGGGDSIGALHGSHGEQHDAFCPFIFQEITATSYPVAVFFGQFDLLSALLRRFPAERFKAFDENKNLYSTTIFVLTSAIQKVARSAKIVEGTPFYRGLAGVMELPDYFLKADNQGRRGYAEWGFMSTTSDKSIALFYSGVREGKPLPMVLVMEATSVDRGACIQAFSQYPQVLYFVFILRRA